MDPIQTPRLVGSMGIFLLFMLVLAAVVTSLLKVRDRWGVPALSLLLVLAVAFSWLNISDNHIPPLVERARMRHRWNLGSWFRQSWHFSHGSRPVTTRLTLRAASSLIRSSSSRPRVVASTRHSDGNVPARAQDRCPNFAQHVFAISSVSGGSIGAGIFSASGKEFAQNTTWQGCKFGDLGVGPFEAKSNAILNRDFLSPVVAAALFGDLPNVFVPILKPNSDRARAFDMALESAWDEALPGVEEPS